VGVQEENEAPLGPEAREEENGEEISPPHPTLGVPVENGFTVI